MIYVKKGRIELSANKNRENTWGMRQPRKFEAGTWAEICLKLGGEFYLFR